MYQINSIEQLQKAGNFFQAIFAINNHPDYLLSISSIPVSTNEEISHKLNHYKNECGCTVGAVTTGLSILFIVSAYLTGYADIHSIDLKQFLLLMLTIAGTATVGKASAILFARIRMVLLIRETAALLESQKNISLSNLNT